MAPLGPPPWTRTRSQDQDPLPGPAPPLARNSGRAAPPGGYTWLALSEGLPRPCLCFGPVLPSTAGRGLRSAGAQVLVMLPSWGVPRGVVGRGVKFPQAPSWLPGSTLSLVPDADPGPSPSGQLEATWHKALVSTGDPPETQEKGLLGNGTLSSAPVPGALLMGAAPRCPGIRLELQQVQRAEGREGAGYSRTTGLLGGRGSKSDWVRAGAGVQLRVQWPHLPRFQS